MTNEILNTKATFEDLVNKANDIQSKCQDSVVDANSILMTEDLTINGMMLSPLATGELCGKLHIPGRYFSRMVEAKQNQLAADNVNTWLVNDKRQFMLREYDGHIRGVMSGSYSQYDTPDILASIQTVFGNDRFTLKGSFINEERLHMRLVENQKLDIENEDLFAGITIDSSDVGRSGLYADLFIYKQVCTNGLKVKRAQYEIFRQKHIGITPDEFKQGLEDGLNIFDEAKDKVKDMIIETKKYPVQEDIDALKENVKKQTLLSDDDVTEVFDLAAVKYNDNTMWGIINGITEVAQKFTLERRLQLEEIAGSMIK